MIRHDGGIETAYMHLAKFAEHQKVGQRIEAKTVIGYVGTTGLSTGPHLHFGVKKNGEYIDPTKLAPMRGKSRRRRKTLTRFKAEVGKLEALLANDHGDSASRSPVSGHWDDRPCRCAELHRHA